MTYLTRYDIQSFSNDIENPNIKYGSQNREACYSGISTRLKNSFNSNPSSKLNTYIIIALPKKYPGTQYATYPENLYKLEFFKRWAEILKENLDLDITYVDNGDKDESCYYKINLTPYLREVDVDNLILTNNTFMHKFLLLVTTIVRYSYESVGGGKSVSKHIVEIYEENKEYVNKSNFFDFLNYVFISPHNISPNGGGHTFAPTSQYDKWIWKYKGKSLLSKLFKMDKLYPLPSVSNSGNTTFLATGLATVKVPALKEDSFYATEIDYKALDLTSFKTFYDYIITIKQNG